MRRIALLAMILTPLSVSASVPEPSDDVAIQHDTLVVEISFKGQSPDGRSYGYHSTLPYAVGNRVAVCEVMFCRCEIGVFAASDADYQLEGAAIEPFVQLQNKRRMKIGETVMLHLGTSPMTGMTHTVEATIKGATKE